MSAAIQWIPVGDALPDADITVMVFDSSADEPVWLGFLDGDDWRSVDGQKLNVSHWAEMPAGPDVENS